MSAAFEASYANEYLDLAECSVRVTGRRLLLEVFPPPPNQAGLIAPPGADRDYPLTARVISAGKECTEVEDGDLIVLGGASLLFFPTVDGQRALADEGGVVLVVTNGSTHSVDPESVGTPSIISASA